MKIVISKAQWEEIGKKAGWDKESSQLDRMKEIRKPMPRPTEIIKDKKRKMKEKKFNWKKDVKD